jgi:hypothetical protein
MIPKYPFCVSVWKKIGMNKLDLRTKSFETLAAASAYAGIALRGESTKRVMVYCILEDQHRNEPGDVAHFDREARI